MIYHQVKDWMTKEVLTVEPDLSLKQADQLMADNFVRRLPVVENGRVIGIVSLGDMREARHRYSGDQADSVRVRDIMTEDPITIRPDASMGLAAQTMLQTKASGLPVAGEDGCLVGVVSSSDVFRMVVQDWHEQTSLNVVGGD